MTIERFKNNWQPQMDGYARFSFNLDLKELVQQIRTDVIDEFANKIKEYSGEHYLDCDGYGCQTELVFRTEEFLDDIVEQLKEQKNE